ncbi:MAG: tryptophan-rich sensory protein, partial [Lachnospiraceae bacterium]|nr:tryptophan-rich sensory protein [Lachnospiraceae bacterium]
MKNYNFKFLILSIAIALAIGGISYQLTGDNYQIYETLKLPPLSPAPIVFPIVWTILYILMGIATYLFIASVEKKPITKMYDPLAEAKKGLLYYAIQLAFNLMWSPVFFRFHFFFSALIILTILWYFVYQTYNIYKGLCKTAALLFLPYIVWCT